ncbi:MAG: SCO family protein [Acidimicrobiales bacterium]
MGPQSILTEAERAAALSEPPPKVPRSAVLWTVIACLVLGLGGVAVDHFIGAGSAGSLTPLPTSTVPPPQRSLASGGGQLPATAAALMALQRAGPGPAPRFRLSTIAGKSISLTQFRGKVVVLSFFDARCNDICPVLERELAQAMSELAKKGFGHRVECLTVNTDPYATAAARAAPAVRGIPPNTSNWLFLTGSLNALDSVWKSYGITVDGQPATGLVSHTDALYFITPKGNLAAQATPTANEVGKGVFRLPASTMHLFAHGIAAETEHLLTGGRG